MSKQADAALECFSKGCNCAQAVFSTYAPQLGISKEDAIRISTGFGAGISRLQEVCGAVTGGVLAISAAKGMNNPSEKDAKEATYAAVQDFVERFRARHSTILCRDLLHCDLSTPEGRRTFEEKNLHATRCAIFVRDASAIVETDVLDAERPTSLPDISDCR